MTDRYNPPDERLCLKCDEYSPDRWICDCPDCGRPHYECQHCGEDLSEQ